MRYIAQFILTLGYDTKNKPFYKSQRQSGPFEAQDTIFLAYQ